VTTTIEHVNPLDLDDAGFLAKAQAMCSLKAAYVSRGEANAFAKRRGYALAPYLCPWCGHWHFTSYDRARAKAFTRRLKRLLRLQVAS
jgi:hypothetical protein